ncbi:FKBP-type peptidyl-prolyl cis-trans isomerase [Thioalkalivibrio sulfidiphilus]|uniref:FKBP-type peptidyl-prolyl cis-trans isomerase n=1 Tax=Thioalkalivibrio sulfidiphilus TaxID=1033854 RepID=UPI00039CB13C|nr:hypothetical protein [Thioalkalivibrio sulfidiphilus]
MKIETGSLVTLTCHVSDDETGEDLHPILNLDPGETLRYLHGKTTPPVPGLAQALQGLEAGFEGVVTIPPVLAFGDYRPELVFEAVRENLPDVPLEPGQPLYTRGQTGVFSLRVVRLTDKGAILDGNHPLAGRTLRMTVKIMEVRMATPEELRTAHGQETLDA